MNFNEMHDLSKHIDAQITSLESKLACPINMVYSNSNQGVKILSMLRGMIENVASKKVPIQFAVFNWLNLLHMTFCPPTLNPFKIFCFFLFQYQNCVLFSMENYKRGLKFPKSMRFYVGNSLQLLFVYKQLIGC